MGGFDLDGAQAVAGADGVERYQVLDQLSLLVDKSLVVAENTGGKTRYRMLETVRQYALEQLGESGEADAVRARHRDYYTSMAALLDAPAGSDYEQRVEQAEIEMGQLAKRIWLEAWITLTSTRRWRWHRRYNRYGSREAASWKAGRGSIPFSPKAIRTTS